MTGSPARLVTRILPAPATVVALALLVRSADSPGDGFSAGLILATAVLINYIVLGQAETERRLPLRWAPHLMQLGLLVMVAVAAQSLIRGHSLLVHAPGAADPPVAIGTLKLSTAFAFDLGIFMIVAGGMVTLAHAIGHGGHEKERDE